jgi:hypothetical protein
MNRILRLAIVLSGSLGCSTAIASDLFHCLGGCAVPDCVGKWCCPDYCPKPEPCVHVPLCCCCDDYCPKQEPCVCVPLMFCCDDYCPKCPPAACSRPSGEYLRCGGPRCCSPCATKKVCSGCSTEATAVSRGETLQSSTQGVTTGENPQKVLPAKVGFLHRLRLNAKRANAKSSKR